MPASSAEWVWLSGTMLSAEAYDFDEAGWVADVGVIATGANVCDSWISEADCGVPVEAVLCTLVGRACTVELGACGLCDSTIHVEVGVDVASAGELSAAGGDLCSVAYESAMVGLYFVSRGYCGRGGY